MSKKWRFVAVTMVMLLVLSLAGCEKKGVCEWCGNKTVLYRFTETSSLLGIKETKTFKLCEECMDEEISRIDSEDFGLTTYTHEKIE